MRIPCGGVDERIGRISREMMDKYKLSFVQAKSTGDFLKKYVDQIFHIWDETYDKIYGTVPFTDKVKRAMLNNFKLVIDLRFIAAIVDENDRIVAFGVVFPSMAKAVQKSGGRLTPACLTRLLADINNPSIVDMALIGVLDEYKNKGIATALVSEFSNRMTKYGIDYAETNLMLEHNSPIQNLWKHFDTTQHKRRRCFIKKIR